VQVGSSGALYGLLAVLLVELFQNWPMLAVWLAQQTLSLLPVVQWR
jgi:hypothetical protein